MEELNAIKDAVYKGVGGGTGLTFTDIMLILLIALVLGIYIYAVYKLTSKSAFYSKDLNITLAGMVIIVAFIMIAMQSSLVVSLGMVGALSIVRFRNAIKNPMDLLYLFWAMSTGIICGVGLKLLAVILCIVMTLVLLLLGMLPNSKAPSLLFLQSSSEEMDWKSVINIIEQNTKYYKEKSRNIRKTETELIIELRSQDTEKLCKELKSIKGLEQINLLSHDGELRI